MLIRQWRYFLFGFIFLISLLPAAGYALSDREVYDLLSSKSEDIKEFPFNVYVSSSKDRPPHYGIFDGRELPVSSYAFFSRILNYNLRDSKMPGEMFATFKFAQGDQWKCFILRVPGMYAVEQIDLWVFDTKKNTWLAPIMIAERWGDAGLVIDVQTWIEDINEDGWLDVVRRTLEVHMTLDDPKCPMDLNDPDPKCHNTKKITNEVFIWDNDHFRDASKEYSNKLNFKKYQFKKNNINTIK